MNNKIFIAALGLVVAIGCHKKDDDDNDVTPSSVSINVSDPADGQNYHSGDTVYIKAAISAPGELHGYEVQIKDAAGNALFDDAQHTHADKFNVSEKWAIASSAPADLTATIIVYVDHNGAEAKKNLSLHIVP